jgi:hypothetical protein
LAWRGGSKGLAIKAGVSNEREGQVNNAINPYIAGSPVRDPSMYFGREHVFESIHRCLVESVPTQVVVVHGQRRAGKTSTLYQLAHHLPEHYVPVLVDLQGMSLEGMPNLLWEMAQVIRRGLRRDANIVLPREDREIWFAAPERGIRLFFEAVGQQAGERHIVLMFDETMLLVDKIDAGTLEEQVFACLADLMAGYPFLDFVFSIGSTVGLMEDELTTLPRQATYLQLGFLEPHAARALICEPVRDSLAYQAAAVDRILALTAGQPYYTQLVCHELFAHMQSVVQGDGRNTITQADVEAVRPGIVDMATAQLHYVWDRTPPLGQRVLWALAQTADEGRREHTVEQVARFLVKHGILVTDAEIAEALYGLEARKIVNGQRHYSFHIDLFRHWVLQHQSLEWM